MLGFPFPNGYGWCKAGSHIAALSDLIAREGGRYCSSHMPPENAPKEFLPLESDYETAAMVAYKIGQWRKRHRARAEHIRWMVNTGRLTGDTAAVELTDEEKDRLARYFVP